MNGASSTAKWDASVRTPLKDGNGDETFRLESFHGTERLGRLFDYELELSSANYEINSTDIIGKRVTIRLALPSGSDRYFDGFVSRFVQTPPLGGAARYQATLVPWLWFLTRRSDCRIFGGNQKKVKIREILDEVFRKYKFKGDPFDMKRLKRKTYRDWQYCVQYRESDFNFVSRLMEQEGIYYFFEHDSERHGLVLADSPDSHDERPKDQIRYRHLPPTETDTLEPWVWDVVVEREFQPVKYSHKDFNFRSPRAALGAKETAPMKDQDDYALQELEIFDFPGEFDQREDGEEYARIRLQEFLAREQLFRGVTNSREIRVGATFTLKDYPVKDRPPQKLLVTSTNFSIQLGGYEAGGSGKQGFAYQCSFMAIDANTRYRSERITPKPIIQGPQTAIVWCPEGQEIDTDDKYGLVRVCFHWDRHGKTSIPVRISQQWAGDKWGAFFIPRKGQEVIVDFTEGDPDRPIVTGCVYNDDQKPPYDLPTNKTQSGIKTRSKDGSADNFNEIRFEDKKGDEQIVLHAEKDLLLTVEHNKSETVQNDKSIIVDGKHTEVIKLKYSVKSTDDAIELHGNGKGAEVVGKGGQGVNVYGEPIVNITGATKIGLFVGDNSIVIDGSGVTIKGKMVKINCD